MKKKLFQITALYLLVAGFIFCLSPNFGLRVFSQEDVEVLDGYFYWPSGRPTNRTTDSCMMCQSNVVACVEQEDQPFGITFHNTFRQCCEAHPEAQSCDESVLAGYYVDYTDINNPICTPCPTYANTLEGCNPVPRYENEYDCCRNTSPTYGNCEQVLEGGPPITEGSWLRPAGRPLSEVLDEYAIEPSELGVSLYNLILPAGVAIGFFAIVLAGYAYLTSQGDPTKVKDASEKLTAAILGIIFIVLSLVILKLAVGLFLDEGFIDTPTQVPPDGDIIPPDGVI